VLLEEIVSADLPQRMPVPLALASRNHQRIAKHLMNILSSVVMPLDSVDYFDAPRRPEN
jgi:hypothetical protein